MNCIDHAIQSKSISNVTFKDIRFVCIWSRSAPGFYAAVKIGLWQVWSQDMPVPFKLPIHAQNYLSVNDDYFILCSVPRKGQILYSFTYNAIYL